jgi:cytochrome P450
MIEHPGSPMMDEARAHELAAGFDPNSLGPEFHDDPYPTYAALREFDPIHRCPDGTYFLTRYADLDQIYRDRNNFSSDKKSVFGPKFAVGSPLYEHHTSSLVFNDPPYHTRVRRQIVGALTPSVIQAMEHQVIALVDRLLDRIEAQCHFDLIDDFAAAIPVEVIGNLLKVPREDRGPLRGWSLAILGALEASITDQQRAAGDRAVHEFTAYLAGLVADRRRNPDDDDLLTRLLREQDLSSTELLHNCVFLLNAGHETTTNLIGNGAHLLLQHPQALRHLLDNPQLISTAVEECLRFESSNQLGNRLVIHPVHIRGIELQAGAYLTLCIGAANRDAEEFPQADVFDIARKPNRHLAFAAGGHACAGMSVARLEAQVALLRLFQRFPDLHLAGSPVRGERARFRGFRSLPATVA